MKAKFDAKTNTGLVRENNEDCFIAQHLWNNTCLLCAAIDGMGGYEGGEVAASIARDAIVDYLSSCPDCDNMKNMGCVATVGVIDLENAQLYMAHVGDSRLYQFRDGRLQKLSHDHSLVGYREEIGELTEEEAMANPNRSIISKSLGDKLINGMGQDYIELGIFPLQSGTQLLFSTDGLFDMATSKEIEDILSKEVSVKEKTLQLIDLANTKGGKDNITVVLVEVGHNANKKVKKPPKTKHFSPTEQDDDSTINIHVNLLAVFLILAFCVGFAFGFLLKYIF